MCQRFLVFAHIVLLHHRVSASVFEKLLQHLPKTRDADFAGIKFFLYELPSVYHGVLQHAMEQSSQEAGSNCDFMLSPCTERKYAGRWTIDRQRGQEIIILRKFLAQSSAQVRDPREADIFVVPYLVASDCRLGGFLQSCTLMHTSTLGAKDVFAHLEHYNAATRHRHLFLATADIHNLPRSIQAQSLLVTKGATWGHSLGHLVAPTAVTEVELQPNSYEDKFRDILFHLVQTPNNAVRAEVQRQLIVFNEFSSEQDRQRLFGRGGEVRVSFLGRQTADRQVSPSTMVAQMQRSLFCPAPPAETSGGLKRMIDAVLSGCIPVVISFKTVWGSGVSWWRHNGAPIEWSLPFPWEIDWHRLAIEVPADSLFNSTDRLPGLVAACAALNQVEIDAKRRYLLEVRNKLVYDLHGGSRDAFSLLMDGIRKALERHAVAPPFNLHERIFSAANPLICDVILRLQNLREVPREIGGRAGSAKDWSSSFGEVVCSAATQWHAPSHYWTESAFNAAKGSTESGIIITIQRHVPDLMMRTTRGNTLFKQQLVLNSVVQEDAPLILASSPLSICRHGNLPEACHEGFEQVSQHRSEGILRKCGSSHVVDGLPMTACRLLPAPTPKVIPATLAASPLTVWEVVFLSCSADHHPAKSSAQQQLQDVADEMDAAWLKMPQGHELHIVVYDICDSGHSHDLSVGLTLVEHVVATAIQQHSDAGAPYAMIIVADATLVEGTRPRHIVNFVLTYFVELHNNRGWDGLSTSDWQSWLMGFDGAEWESYMCEAYRHISSACPLPEEHKDMTLKGLAFTTDLLSVLPQSHWEVLAAFPKQVLLLQGGLSMIYVSLFMAARSVPDAFLLRERTFDLKVLHQGSSLPDCFAAFSEGGFADASGVPLFSGNAELFEQASACLRLGGSYSLVETGLPHFLLNRTDWEPYPKAELIILTMLGSLSESQWKLVEAYGVCLPPLPTCHPEHAAAAGWYFLVHHFWVDSAKILLDLPQPYSARIRDHMASLAEVENVLGRASTDQADLWASESAAGISGSGKYEELQQANAVITPLP